MAAQTESAVAPVRRVVLLGASNLARGIGCAIETARTAWGRPIDVMATPSHGRSYGRNSSVLGRVLPGIIQCRLWDDLQQRPVIPTAALITDVGNDLLYYASVPEVLDWVAICLDRLKDVDARCVVMELPVENLQRLGVWRYRFFRTTFFPSCKIDLPTMQQRVCALNEQLADLAHGYGAQVFKPKLAWYGIDPVHIRRQKLSLAWSEMLAHWNGKLTGPCHASLASEIYLRRLRPYERRLWGFTQRRSQPAGTLCDGTRVSFY